MPARYKFNLKKTNKLGEPRVSFANDICKDIFSQVEDDSWSNIAERVKLFYSHFQNNVRNIYQFVEHHIPLFAWHELTTYTAKDLDLTNEEYLKAIDTVRKACVKYYRQ